MSLKSLIYTLGRCVHFHGNLPPSRNLNRRSSAPTRTKAFRSLRTVFASPGQMTLKQYLRRAGGEGEVTINLKRWMRLEEIRINLATAGTTDQRTSSGGGRSRRKPVRHQRVGKGADRTFDSPVVMPTSAHRSFQRQQHQQITDLAAFKQKVKLVFVSYGNREIGGNCPGGTRGGFDGDPKVNVEALKAAGINSVWYVSPETAHEWQSWRRSLYQFAPLVFRN
jgi:hypothetical protein